MKMKFKIQLVLLISFVIILNSIPCYTDEKIEVDDSESSSTNDKKSFYNNKLKVKYVKPSVKGDHHFIETFESDSIGVKWIKSRAKKDDVDESISKYEGQWSIESSTDSVFEGDKGLVLKSKAKHHAISARLAKPFLFTNNKPLIVQYEVKFQQPLECGGAYVKLLSDEPDLSLENLYDKTGFSIMFGPDKCGSESKYHFIIRYRHPTKGTYEEKHVKKTEMMDTYFSDGKTHLYTLIVEPDNSYKMMVDLTEVNSGSLLKDFNPPINPPKEIVDPNDKKPESWDDRAKIPDPDAVKPEDWDENEPKQIVDPNAKMPEGWLEDESETITDSSAVKPEDWDDETDGEWEAPKLDNPKCKNAPGCGKWNPPLIENPKYKGKWRAPLIENPNYQGVWEPRKIANPDFFEDNNPFKSLTAFSAIGLELWSMTENIYFDNFLITDDKSVAELFAKDSWALKKSLETINSRSSDSVIDGLINAANDKPWLWALYLLVILLPIVIIAVFCCGKSPSKHQTQHKKTDEPTPDDDTKSNENEEPSDEAAAEENAEEAVEENADSNDLMSKSTVQEPADEEESVGNTQESPRKAKRRAARKE